MTNRITPILALLALTGCPSTTPVAEPLCSTDASLALEIGSVERPDAANLLRGVDLDGETTPDEWFAETDYVDPDGTSGVDSAATDMDALVEALFGHGIDRAIAGQTVGIDLAFASNPEGLCSGLSVGIADGPLRPAEWNGSTYRAHRLGSVRFELTFGDVTTEVLLRDVSVRVEVEGGAISDIVVGGWIASPDVYRAMVAGVGDVPDMDRDELEELLWGAVELAADMEIDDDGVANGLSFMFHVDGWE